MKKIIINTMLIALVGMLITSCKKEKGAGNNNDALIDPADANALSAVVVMPTGSTRANGSMPSVTGDLQTPVIASLVSDVITSNGSTAPFLYTYSNVTSNIAGFYVQIVGSGSYFTVPFPGTSTSSGQINLPLGLPTNVGSGNFCLLFSAYDRSGHVSNQVTICAVVMRLGTGALQVSLSWNTATDQDLWVTDPPGTKIYYDNKTSSSGGQLDRDDVDGYGPENIYWLSNAPDGDYKVQVNDYRFTNGPNTCYVTVNAPGKSKSFTVTTQRNSIADVLTIHKHGTNYDF